MSYTVEEFPGEPIVLTTLPETLDYKRDLPLMFQEVIDLFNRAEERYFFICDVRESPVSLPFVVEGASMAARGEDAVLHHPNMGELLMVTTHKMIEIATEGLRHAAFGHVEATAFTTPEEALDYARRKIAEERGG